MNIDSDDIIGRIATDPTYARTVQTYYQLDQLASEFDEWTFDVLQNEDGSAVGLHNVGCPENLADGSAPVCIGVFPMADSTYYVIPQTLRPVSAEFSYDDSELLSESGMTSVRWELVPLESEDPFPSDEPLMTSQETVERVRQYCEIVG